MRNTGTPLRSHTPDPTFPPELLALRPTLAHMQLAPPSLPCHPLSRLLCLDLLAQYVQTSTPICMYRHVPASVAGLDLLARYVDIDAAYDLSPEQLVARVREADALIVRSGTQVKSGTVCVVRVGGRIPMWVRDGGFVLWVREADALIVVSSGQVKGGTGGGGGAGGS